MNEAVKKLITEMTGELANLQDEYFKCYGALNKHSGFIESAEQRATMTADLIELYTVCYKLIKQSHESELITLKLRMQMTNTELTPKTWRSWLFRRKQNRSMEILSEEIKIAVKGIFEDREQLIKGPDEPEEEPERATSEARAAAEQQLTETLRKADATPTSETFNEPDGAAGELAELDELEADEATDEYEPEPGEPEEVKE